MIRRFTKIKTSRGTVIPQKVRDAVKARDQGCVMKKLDPEHLCFGGPELDHVRAGGMGIKSPSTLENLVLLCAQAHRTKTNSGRTWRPRLIAYLESEDIQSDPYTVALATKVGKP